MVYGTISSLENISSLMSPTAEAEITENGSGSIHDKESETKFSQILMATQF